jgi:hypothetical protein
MKARGFSAVDPLRPTLLHETHSAGTQETIVANSSVESVAAPNFHSLEANKDLRLLQVVMSHCICGFQPIYIRHGSVILQNLSTDRAEIRRSCEVECQLPCKYNKSGRR